MTAGQIVRMYESRYITNAAATARLTALNFPTDEITLMLGYADDLRTEKLLNAGITKIGTVYVAHKIDKPTATTALTGMGLTAAAAGEHFAIWDIERTALIHHLTPAQIVGAYRRTDIPALECKNRLIALGVQPGDLSIMVADGWPPSQATAGKAAAAAVVNA